jgi:hypothetical protein
MSKETYYLACSSKKLAKASVKSELWQKPISFTCQNVFFIDRMCSL